MAKVVVERVFRAPPARLFRAWTDPGVMARWFFVEPGWSCAAESDLRPGGRYRVVMTRADSSTFTAEGEYVEVTPPSRLVFTWASDSPRIAGSVVTLELTRAGVGATRLVLTHDLLPDTDEGRAHAIGWRGCFDRLDELFDKEAET